MTIRDRVAQFLLGEQYRELKNTQAAFRAAWEYRPWGFAHDDITRRLAELSPDALRWLENRQGWEAVSSLGGGEALTEQDRLREVYRARWADEWLILHGRMRSMWTDFAFGLQPAVTIDNEDAQEVWNEFAHAQRNSYVIAPSVFYTQSDTILVDGEVYWVFTTDTVTGETTLRTVPTDQIASIITRPGDALVPVLYERRSESSALGTRTRLYRDWRATSRAADNAIERLNLADGALRAEQENPGSDVLMMQVAHERRNGRGWPRFYKSVWWSYEYQQFLIHRLSLSRAVATMWEDFEVQGGSRAVDYARQVFQSTLSTSDSENNPPPTASAPFVHNAGVRRQRMPLTTGAGDAQVDGLTLASLVALDGGLPPHWLGRPDAMQNRATARETLRPVVQQWARYQLFWSSTIKDTVRLVLTQAASYPRDNPLLSMSADEISELDVDVNLDIQLTDTDFEAMVDALVKLSATSIMPAKELARVALKLPQLGVTDPEEVLGTLYPDNATGMVTEEERAIIEAAARVLAGGA